MVVDAAAFLRNMLKDILEKEGHTVVAEAKNGVEAVEKYRAFRPDFVTLDLNMPEMDGTEALEEIMRTDPKAKIIICSTLGQRPLIIDSIRRGAKDYILKPFHADRVVHAVERVLLPAMMLAE